MSKNLDRWLHSWLFRRRASLPAERHVFIAVCDHFEPFHKGSKTLAMDRVGRWQRECRKFAGAVRASGGVGPRHSLFYPIEPWEAEMCAGIAELCHATGSEMEIHLHHENDTAENLARVLEEGKERLAQLGCLARDEQGRGAFGFIHGNWALDHSHPNGRACGVANELAVLKAAGCYADFTLPSAPSRCQVGMINTIYYAREDGKPRSHARGTRARAGTARPNSAEHLLLITGPLGLNWQRRKWGLLPRIENADLTGANPPTPTRLRLWEKCHAHVQGRPEWIFIKLHTHGGIERNSDMLLGDPMRAFHRHLRERAAAEPGFHYHYVTAREMTNLVYAAEAGESGDPAAFRDFVYRRGATPAPGAVATQSNPASAETGASAPAKAGGGYVLPKALRRL
jgi:hypothetical protein